MPHQCTSCGRTFPDGSKEMLSGCPDCGGNKFQFKPKGRDDAASRDAASRDAASRDAASRDDARNRSGADRGDARNRSGADARTTPESTSDSAAQESKRTSSTGNEGVTTDVGATADEGGTLDETDHPESSTASTPSTDRSPTTDDASETASSAPGTEHLGETEDEDTAQASARSDVVTPDELDRASQPVSTDDIEASEASSDDRPDIDELRDELNEQFESIRIVSPGKYELNLMELYDRQEYIISLQEDGRYVIEMPDAWGVKDE